MKRKKLKTKIDVSKGLKKEDVKKLNKQSKCFSTMYDFKSNECSSCHVSNICLYLTKYPQKQKLKENALVNFDEHNIEYLYRMKYKKDTDIKAAKRIAKKLGIPDVKSVELFIKNNLK